MGLFNLFTNTSTLFFAGCATKKYPGSVELQERILDRLNIPFENEETSKCCGISLLEQGYEIEGRKFIRANFENLKINGIKRLITFCPKCFKAFKQDYPEILPDWNLEVTNLWDLILEKLESRPRLIKHKENETVGFQDSCYLGRYCNIYDSPREILKLLGYEIKEFQNSRENSACCGSCGDYNIINPAVADQMAKERIIEAKRIGLKKIVVLSLEECELLRKNSQEIEILEFSEILALGLGIKKPKKSEEEKIIETEIKEEIIEEIDISGN